MVTVLNDMVTVAGSFSPSSARSSYLWQLRLAEVLGPANRKLDTSLQYFVLASWSFTFYFLEVPTGADLILSAVSASLPGLPTTSSSSRKKKVVAELASTNHKIEL